ncbi:metallophosphoesterase [Desulfobacterales bacterium HSG16]|nr:metallophosphoesterase [Desulfobacterales bacterium HSG16]
MNSSSETITWLHISDLHFRKSHDFNETIVLKELVRDVKSCIEQDGVTPDFIAVTGDIAFSGASSEYDLARNFFDKLQEATGVPREKLFIVPGNHDVDRKLITGGAKAIGASLTDRDKVNTFLVTPGDRHLIMERFKGYSDFFNDYFGGIQAFDDENFFYVRAFDVGGRTIAVSGINSSWLAGPDEDRASGLVIGERQVRAALDKVEQAGADLSIAIMHHPFDWLREFDQNDSATLLLDKWDFILSGHLHKTSTTQLTDPDTNAMTITGGACYEKREFPNTYNFVQLNPAAGKGTVHLRRYSDERVGFWVKDVMTYRNASDGKYEFSFQRSEPISGNVENGKDRVVVTRMEPADKASGKSDLTGSVDNDTNPLPSTDTASVRRRVKELFDDTEFEDFCQDHFRDVYDKFGKGQGKNQKINILMEHYGRSPAHKQKLLSELEKM